MQLWHGKVSGSVLELEDAPFSILAGLRREGWYPLT